MAEDYKEKEEIKENKEMKKTRQTKETRNAEDVFCICLMYILLYGVLAFFHTWYRRKIMIDGEDLRILSERYGGLRPLIAALNAHLKAGKFLLASIRPSHEERMRIHEALQAFTALHGGPAIRGARRISYGTTARPQPKKPRVTQMTYDWEQYVERAWQAAPSFVPAEEERDAFAAIFGAIQDLLAIMRSSLAHIDTYQPGHPLVEAVAMPTVRLAEWAVRGVATQSQGAPIVLAAALALLRYPVLGTGENGIYYLLSR